MVKRYVAGLSSGLLVAFLVYFLLGLVLRNRVEGMRPWDTVVGFVLPHLLGLLADIQSFRRSVRRMD
jgi:hypothetical protein